MLKDAHIQKGTKVLVRADFDVSVKNGKVEDEFRIKELIPTLKFILRRGGAPRIIAHRGRPNGEKTLSLTLSPVVRCLRRLLKQKVIFVSNPLQKEAFSRYRNSKDILVFENIRFFPGEEKAELSFTKALARWGNIYVNDAFASSHRTHASISSLPRVLPSYAGAHLVKEVEVLSQIFKKPKPLVLILGGAKLETKLPLIKRFLSYGAEVLVGGRTANVLLSAAGFTIGGVSEERPLIKKLRGLARSSRLHLPLDVYFARDPRAKAALGGIREIPRSDTPYDIGPKTVRAFLILLRQARTIVWNGPMGLIEVPKFSSGTLNLAKGMKELSAFKVLGGGDTIAFLRKHRALRGFNHISTGGGAMLEFLAGKKLPGIEALKKS